MSEETKYCENCKKDVPVFHQKYSTWPGTENEVRKYHDIICSYCGQAIVHEHVDEIPQQGSGEKYD